MDWNKNSWIITHIIWLEVHSSSKIIQSFPPFCNKLDKKVNEEGVTSIEDKPRPGRPSKLNEKVVGVLEEALSKSPEEYKLSRFRWDSVVIVEFIKRS